MTDGRTRAAGAFALSSLFVIGTIAPAAAAPSWDEANQRAETLGSTADRLAQGQARLTGRLQDARRELTTVDKRLDRVATDRRQARRQLVELLVDDAADGGRVVAGDVLRAGALVDIQLVAESETQLVRRERRTERTAERLAGRQDELQRTVRRLGVARDEKRPEARVARQRADQATALVERMREARASRAAEREERKAEAAASSGAAAVVSYAMAQVGDPYVWGATGPDAFDCSGFTMAAWAQAGVSLPHQSAAQMSSGTPVSTDALMPGDLVFYYSPVSHVGIYIGNGQIVHAGNPSTGVAVAPLHLMPLVGAVRPG